MMTGRLISDENRGELFLSVALGYSNGKGATGKPLRIYGREEFT